ncbi:UNVERIFIED_CONTAM: hypothetical protein DES50_110133 [Williamsia faeni]
MFGKTWVSGTATIVAVNIVRVSSDGQTPTREFAADIVVPGIDPFRAKLTEPRWTTDFWPPSAREIRGVLREAKSGAVRFDMKDPRNSYKHHGDAAADAFRATLEQPPNPPAS